jgi:hypothetical protein
MDSDDEDAPMPAHVNSAQAVQREMERRRRSRERKAQQLATLAGSILPSAGNKDDFDDVANQLRELHARIPPTAGTLTVTIPAGSQLRNRILLGETLSAVSSVAPQVQQTSIRNLEPVFKKFTDTEVSVYAMDEQPIGPRIGITDVPEPTLKALAGVEVQRRGRLSDRKWAIIGGGLAALVTGVVAWILRGVLGA